MKNETRKRGVVILYAVLLMSVVLAISLGIFNITYRQILLSSVARESEIAFLAADSGRHCAMFWDSPFYDLDTGYRLNTPRPFGYVTVDINTLQRTFNSVSDAKAIACGGDSSVQVTGNDATGRDFTVFYDLGDRTACAKVTVTKNGDVNVPETTITSNGYNLAPDDKSACPSGNTNRVVERTVESVFAR